jgi:hypothetical protein
MVIFTQRATSGLPCTRNCADRAGSGRRADAEAMQIPSRQDGAAFLAVGRGPRTAIPPRRRAARGRRSVPPRYGRRLLRCGISIRPVTAWGHSRRTEEPRRFAECPLCFHQRLNLCVATKRREVRGLNSVSPHSRSSTIYRLCLSSAFLSPAVGLRKNTSMVQPLGAVGA